MASIRQQKIEALLQRELAIIFQENSRDHFGGAFITVTTVRVSPDLSFVKVFLSFMVAGDKQKGLDLVNQKKGLVRKLLGGKVGKSLRIVPELAFFIDDSLDYAQGINDLLK